jgi:hypothetical protein
MNTELNEDCGCGAGASSEAKTVNISKRYPDPNLGKVANLFDGRQAIVDDSIRSTTGDVIGYVLKDTRGSSFRVFKDKIQNFSESMGAMSTLGAMTGMGSVQPPTSTSDGSGDQFPTIGGGSPRDTKKTMKDRQKKQISGKLMDFANFSKTMKGFQQPDQKNKK